MREITTSIPRKAFSEEELTAPPEIDTAQPALTMNLYGTTQTDEAIGGILALVDYRKSYLANGFQITDLAGALPIIGPVTKAIEGADQIDEELLDANPEEATHIAEGIAEIANKIGVPPEKHHLVRMALHGLGELGYAVKELAGLGLTPQDVIDSVGKPE